MPAEPLRIHAPPVAGGAGQLGAAGGPAAGQGDDVAGQTNGKGRKRKRPGPRPPRNPLPADLAPERWINIGEVCDLTGLGRSTLERWIAGGRMPQPIRPAGSRSCLRWRWRDIKEWFDAGMPDLREAAPR